MEIQDVSANWVSANTTVTTTAETIAITAPLLRCKRNSAIIMITAWAQLTTGAGTTGVTPQVRRGTAVADPVINEANAVTIGAVAGSTEQYLVTMFEQLTAEQNVQYIFTLTQAAATGNGTILQAGIFVIAV